MNKFKSKSFRKHITQVLAAILSLALMLSLTVLPAAAETSGDYTYQILDNGTVEITGYSGSDTELVIPSEIEGKSVTSIGLYAFDGIENMACERLESVTIPDSVTNIGWKAFSNCTSLTSITIPDSVASISNGAFEGCTSLTSVTIPNSVTTIKMMTFLECSSLTSVTIPNSVTTIEAYAFSGCKNLKSVTIPDSVTTIGEYSFGYYVIPFSTAPPIKYDNFTITGYKGTAAEQYAIDNSFEFIALEPVTVSGDVTGDGEVTLTDSINIQKAALSMKELSEQALKNADMNGDGKISVLDAIIVQKIALKMIV